MFFAKAKEAAAALVEPGEALTPAPCKVDKIHLFMVALAAL